MFTMNENAEAWGFLRPLTWQHVLLVLAVFLAAKLLSGGVRWLLQHWAERVRPRLRLSILRLIPLAHLRSEEHTSELQSQSNLVCRLLLDKKKDSVCNYMASVSLSVQ